MPQCDSSQTGMRAVRPEPSPADLQPDWTAGVSEVSRFSCMKFLDVPWGLRPRRTEQKLALSLLSMLPSAHIYRVGVRVVCFRGSIPTPPILSLRFTVSLAVAAQDSRPSGSLLLSCEALSSSTSCRLSGKAMARTGLRMMPTFPSPPLKFRTAGFPQYGFKAGISDKAFPKKPGFAFVLRAHCFHRVLPALCQGRCAIRHLRASGPIPLYPRGPRSGPGYAVPVHHHLVGPIRPTRGHIPTSPPGGLYEMPSLCLFA